MRAVAIVVATALVVAVACLRTVSYQCSSDSFCQHNGVQGTCESTGFCAFPDTGCSSGMRYGTEGPYSGQCVGSQMMVIDGRIDSPPDVPSGPSYSIGGNVAGVSGSGLVIADNGADQTPIATNGPFTFAQKIVTGFPYDVTVVTAPATQTCIVINASGIVGSANVTNVRVSCTTGTSTDPGIACGGAFCTVGNQMCCHGKTDSTGTCAATSQSCAGGSAQELCDDNADCGGSPNVCCAHLSSTGAISGMIACVSDATLCTASGNSTAEMLCDPTATTPCPPGKTCTGNDSTHGWHYCL